MRLAFCGRLAPAFLRQTSLRYAILEKQFARLGQWQQQTAKVVTPSFGKVKQVPAATLPTLRNSPCFVLLALRALISRLALCGISRPCSLRGNHGGQLDARLSGGSRLAFGKPTPTRFARSLRVAPLGACGFATRLALQAGGSLRSPH